jgi:hypothetical protein
VRRIVASVLAALVAAFVLQAPPAQASGADWDCVYAAAPGTNPGLCIEVRRHLNPRGKLVITYIASHEALPSAYDDFAGTLTIRNNSRKVRWRTWFTHANGQSARAWPGVVRVKTRRGWARLTGEFYHEDGSTYTINRAWRIG